MANNSKIKGFILVYVLWFTALISATVLLIQAIVLSDRYRNSKILDGNLFFTEALSVAKYVLWEHILDTQETSVYVTRYYTINTSTNSYEVEVEVEDGKLSINIADANSLENLFKIVGVKHPRETARRIISERDLGNKEFSSITQLIDYLGVSNFKKVEPYVTIGHLLVNPNYSSYNVLAAIGFKDGEIQRIFDIRSKGGRIDYDYVSQLGDPRIVEKVFFSRSPYMYRLKVKGNRGGSLILILGRNGEIIDLYLPLGEEGRRDGHSGQNIPLSE